MAKYLTQPGQTVIAGVRTDNEPGFAKIIYQNRGLLTIPPILAATFMGKQFFYSDAFTLEETTDTRDYVFVTPDTAEWAHFVFHASGSAITEVSLWEDTVLTSTDALTTYNNNRNSTDAADCLLYLASADTTTDTGSRLIHVKSGSAAFLSRDSMEAGYADELFLRRNTKYRINFATSSTSNLCNLKIQWHEHTNES